MASGTLAGKGGKEECGEETKDAFESAKRVNALRGLGDPYRSGNNSTGRMRKFLAIEEIAEILARDLSINLQNFSQVLYYLR